MGAETAAPQWGIADIPDMRGRVAVVTGANTGLGFHTARMLADAGAKVVLACRDTGKAADAVAQIRRDAPAAELGIVELDLSSLDSVRRAAAAIHAEHADVDLLINNAGSAAPRRAQTADGFELTFGTNHLGPFALTGLLLDLLRDRPGARVVTVSSGSHEQGVLDFDDLHFRQRRYRNWAAYSQSKLANALFGFELQRRLEQSGAQAISVLAHPGAARTDFSRNMGGLVRLMASPGLQPLTSWLVQPAERGALPTVRAAVDPGVSGGEFYAPSGFKNIKGDPVSITAHPRALDQEAQRRLWTESQHLTGVTYPLGEPVDSPTDQETRP